MIPDETVEEACRLFVEGWEGCQPEVQRDCRKDMHRSLRELKFALDEGDEIDIRDQRAKFWREWSKSGNAKL